VHGRVEIALEALHRQLHQLAVGVVGRVQRLGHALRGVAHAGDQLGTGVALGQHGDGQAHEHHDQRHQGNGHERDLARDGTVVGKGG